MTMTDAPASAKQMFAETPEAVFGGEDVGGLDVRTFARSLGLGFRSVPRVSRISARLWGELALVAIGASKVDAAKGDWRFADAAWSENPGFRRLKQAYLAWSD